MKLSEINIYPIKSLKGISLSESVVEKRGLQYDRRWMLTDPDGMFFTQREVPKMAAVTVEVTSEGLRVTSENEGALAIPFEPDRGSRQNVIVWQSEVAGDVYNGAVSEWFSDVLGRKCQLVLMPEKSERHVNSMFDRGDDIVSFADGYPLLLISEGSLEDLNSRLETPLPMNRFRPNVVVAGTKPFTEDKWAKLQIGEANFRVVKPCARCVTTTVDQIRGEFDGKEPLKTLASFRMAKDAFPKTFESFGHNPTSVLFGENLIPYNPGTVIELGDEIVVLEFR